MLTALKTDTGKIRQHNEDDAGIFKGKDEFVLAVVADGMGEAILLEMLRARWL